MKKLIPIENQEGVITARQASRELAKDIGLGTADQTRLATAISELTRNVLIHGGGKGSCELIGESDNSQRRFTATVEDQGPGIDDIDLAMQDGFTTKKSLGAGLPGTKRLMDTFEIQSEPGRTLITISMTRTVL